MVAINWQHYFCELYLLHSLNMIIRMSTGNWIGLYLLLKMAGTKLHDMSRLVLLNVNVCAYKKSNLVEAQYPALTY